MLHGNHCKFKESKQTRECRRDQLRKMLACTTIDSSIAASPSSEGNLAELDLHDCLLTPVDMSIVSQAIRCNKSLTSLNLSQNRLAGDTMINLSTEILTQLPAPPHKEFLTIMARYLCCPPLSRIFPGLSA